MGKKGHELLQCHTGDIDINAGFVVFFKLNGRNMDVNCIHYFSSS